MSKVRSSSILKGLVHTSSEKDLSDSIVKKKSLKKIKKRMKSKHSDAGSSHRRSDSENDRSTNLAGVSSSMSLSTLPEREGNKTEVTTPIITKSKVDKDVDLDDKPISIGNVNKSKKKSEKVVVHVRLRPFNRMETEKKHKSAILAFDTDTNLVSIRKDKAEGTKVKFYFDSLFPENISQEEVYEQAGELSLYWSSL